MGYIALAHLNRDRAATIIHDHPDYGHRSFLTDGSEAGICLSYVGYVGDTITFDLDQPLQNEIYNGVSGPLTQAGSPYTLVLDSTVPSGQTLDIEPGAIIKFYRNRKIIGDGIINADGTVTPIDFIPSNPFWSYSIHLNSKLRLQNGGMLDIYVYD